MLSPHSTEVNFLVYDLPGLLQSKDAGPLLVCRIMKTTARGRFFFLQEPANYGIAFQIVFSTQTVSIFKYRLKTYLFHQAFKKKNKNIQAYLIINSLCVFVELYVRWCRLMWCQCHLLLLHGATVSMWLRKWQHKHILIYSFFFSVSYHLSFAFKF